MHYLSEEWIDAAAAALADHPPAPSPLNIGYTVEGVPHAGTDTHRHTIVLGPDGATVAPGHVEPDIVFTLRWDLAVAIARGERSAQRAFLDGDLGLTGDPNRLLSLGSYWSSVEDRLVAVRALTEY